MKLFSGRNLILFFILPACVIFGFYFRSHLGGSVTRVGVARVRAGDLTQTFRTNGVVEPVNFREIRAQFPGQVMAVLVQEGDRVRAGQSLARLDEREARAAAAQARSQLYEAEQAEANTRNRGTLRQLEGEIAQARADVALAESILHRDDTLLKQRAISQSEFEEASAAHQKASDHLRALEKQRDTLTGELDPPAQKEAQSRVEQARVALQNAESRLEQTRVPAPISGSVLIKPPRPGTLINVGELLAEIGEIDHLQVRAFIDQPDFSSIQVGSPVQMASNGFPGETWEGNVVSLSAVLTTVGKRIVGEAVCSINKDRARLPVNSNVDLTFTSRELHNVLLVPVDAVLQKGGRSYVYALRGGELHLTEVRVGASNADSVVVTGGLKSGEMVLNDLEVPPHEGERVEPRQ
jgi:HlyD family secretion protein